MKDAIFREALPRDGDGFAALVIHALEEVVQHVPGDERVLLQPVDEHPEELGARKNFPRDATSSVGFVLCLRAGADHPQVSIRSCFI